MAEYRKREIEKWHLTYPKTSSPNHKEFDSLEVHDGTQEVLDAQDDLDARDDLDETYNVLEIGADVQILNSDSD